MVRCQTLSVTASRRSLRRRAATGRRRNGSGGQPSRPSPQRGDDRQAKLSQGVIFRHLAHLAAKHPEIEGDGDDFLDDPVIFYLERSCEADPEHIPTVLELIGHYREESRLKDWHRLVDEAVQRFPDNSELLLQATEFGDGAEGLQEGSRVCAQAAENRSDQSRRAPADDRAAGSACPQADPGEATGAGSEGIVLRRPNGNARMPPAPLLRIARGLVSSAAGQGAQAEEWLREGVELAGGGVAGWFRAVLEGELMNAAGGDAGLLRQELARARETPPTKEAVMAIVSALGQPEAGENKRAVSGLLLGMRAWLLQAAAFDWLPAEFQALAETLARFDAFDLLAEYARAARRREPANPIWRFHEIVARTRGNATGCPCPRRRSWTRWPMRRPVGRISTRPTGSNGF